MRTVALVPGELPGDAGFMRRALMLAARGRTHPNPQVGAVIVRDGRIIGEGWHQGLGTPHAEAMAFTSLKRPEEARGATMYVTLEPCSFWTRPDGTPRIPCSDRCIQARVARLVAAMEDPDTRVAGQGFAAIRAAGSEVVVGVAAQAARELNRAYIHHRITGFPYILHKAAITLDGKTAAPGGNSRWITGPEARAQVHRLRNRVDAVVVGVGTILADNPELTTRLEKNKRGHGGNEHNPLRVVIDSTLRTPPDAKVACAGTLIIGSAGRTDRDRQAALEATGAEVVTVGASKNGRVNISEAARLLANRGALFVLLESGGELASAFWSAELVNRALFFIAPKVIGGQTAPTPVDGPGLSERMADAVRLKHFRVRRFGEDIALEAEVSEKSPEAGKLNRID